jgi:hypothetical protein
MTAGGPNFESLGHVADVSRARDGTVNGTVAAASSTGWPRGGAGLADTRARGRKPVSCGVSSPWWNPHAREEPARPASKNMAERRPHAPIPSLAPSGPLEGQAQKDSDSGLRRHRSNGS